VPHKICPSGLRHTSNDDKRCPEARYRADAIVDEVAVSRSTSTTGRATPAFATKRPSRTCALSEIPEARENTPKIAIARSVRGEMPPPSLCYCSNPCGKLPKPPNRELNQPNREPNTANREASENHHGKHPFQGDDFIARSRRRRSNAKARARRMYSLPTVVPQTAKMSRVIWLSSKLSIR